MNGTVHHSYWNERHHIPMMQIELKQFLFVFSSLNIWPMKCYIWKAFTIWWSIGRFSLFRFICRRYCRVCWWCRCVITGFRILEFVCIESTIFWIIPWVTQRNSSTTNSTTFICISILTVWTLNKNESYKTIRQESTAIYRNYIRNKWSYVCRRINRSPDRESSSSVLFEFLLFDILRRPPTDESSFFGVTALFRLISVLDDCMEPFFFQSENAILINCVAQLGQN